MFMKWGREVPDAHNLSSLRLLGSVGEPINPEAWRWYRDAFGGNRTPVVDTVADRDRRDHDLAAARPDSGQARFGDDTAAWHLREVVDEEGKELVPGADEAEHVTGYLVLDQPWPSMLRGIWGDAGAVQGDLLVTVCRAGLVFRRRRARVDSDGNIWLLGRIDDVMNVSGHRISTTEVESALVGHSGVAEAAVVGASDETTGQGICAFVILESQAKNNDNMVDELREQVAKEIGKIARPREIHVVPELPKTRSGKIMRRLLRDVAEGRELGDTSTLVDHPCSRRSGPASRYAAWTADRDEAGPRPVLGDDVGQLGVDRHGDRRRVQRDVLDDAGRQFLGEGTVDHADQPVVDRDRRAGVARLAAHLADDRARLLAGSPDDAARVAGGPAELARDLAERRVGPEAVDLEAVDVVHRRDLGRVELDHRVVEGVIAGHHRAEHTAGLRPLGAHLRPWAAAVCGGEADQVAAVVIADGGQVHNVSPLTTSPEPPPSGSGSSACAREVVGASSAASVAIVTDKRTASGARSSKHPPSTSRPAYSTATVSLSLGRDRLARRHVAT